MMECLYGSVDDFTATLGAQVWTALQYGTVLVLLTALVLWLLGRRVNASVHALLWTVALLKFIVPCGPGFAGSLSQGLDAVGEPISLDAGSVLMSDAHPWLFAAKIVLLSLYGVVTLFLVIRAIGRWRGHAARARVLPPAPEATRGLVAACAGRLGIRPPMVRVSNDPVPPHVAGLLRPILVLPSWLGADPHAEEAFILHELAHLKRRDHWLLLAIALVEIVFFFWPPVRFAARRLRSSREAACDETAVAHGPLGAIAYARSLVGVASRCLGGAAAGGLVPSAVSTRLEERVDYLLAPPRPTRRIWLGLLVTVWGIWALAGSQPPVHPQGCQDQVDRPR